MTGSILGVDRFLTAGITSGASRFLFNRGHFGGITGSHLVQAMSTDIISANESEVKELKDAIKKKEQQIMEKEKEIKVMQSEMKATSDPEEKKYAREEIAALRRDIDALNSQIAVNNTLIIEAERRFSLLTLSKCSFLPFSSFSSFLCIYFIFCFAI